jgi:hypothetical protein
MPVIADRLERSGKSDATKASLMSSLWPKPEKSGTGQTAGRRPEHRENSEKTGIMRVKDQVADKQRHSRSPKRLQR